MTNSKQKGSSWERTISNKLSERFKAYTGIEKSFRRNADSGSFFGGSNASRSSTHDTSKATYGDIITPCGFKWSIECKAYKTPPSLKAILTQSDAVLDAWIKQAMQDATQAGLSPVIIIKWNNVPPVALIEDTMPGPASYKGWSFQKLDDWLNNPNEYFFEGL